MTFDSSFHSKFVFICICLNFLQSPLPTVFTVLNVLYMYVSGIHVKQLTYSSFKADILLVCVLPCDKPVIFSLWIKIQ